MMMIILMNVIPYILFLFAPNGTEPTTVIM